MSCITTRKEKENGKTAFKVRYNGPVDKTQDFPTPHGKGSMLYTNKWTLNWIYENGKRQGTFQVVNKEEDV